MFGLGWRLCFLINVPIGAAALALTPRLVPEARGQGRPRLDLAGVVLITLALVAAVLPLIDGRQQGWPPWTWLCLAAAAVLFLAFGSYQRRLRVRGGAPLIDPALFRERAFTVGLAAQLTFMGMAAYGVALIGIVFYHGLGRTSGARAYPYAFETSLVYLIAVGLALALLVQLLPRGKERE